MKKNITFKSDTVLNLIGLNIQENNKALDFTVIDKQLKPVKMSDYKDKIKVVTSFPSLDTPVCDLQVKEFNSRAVEFDKDVVVIGISNDLPFAQQRFCQANNIKNVTVLSDYKISEFGVLYGLFIKQLHLLARAIIIIDKNDVVRYVQIVDELTKSPDFEKAISALSGVIKNPSVYAEDSLCDRMCREYVTGVGLLDESKIKEFSKKIAGWKIVEDKKIVKEFVFEDFSDALYFVNVVGILSLCKNHHPFLDIAKNKVKVLFTTHSASGLTENDFIMAALLDRIK